MICDAHVHVGWYYRSNGGEENGKGLDCYYSPQLISNILKASGVEEFIFSSLSCQCQDAIDIVEQEALEVVAIFGEGAHPFYWCTGALYDFDPYFKVLDKGIWQGVKIHELETPWVKKRPRDLDRMLSVLEERNVPVQIHTGEFEGCYPLELLPFVLKHPQLRVDFAHCRPHKETISCMKMCPNLFTDTAFMPVEYYKELVDAGLEDRVLFGTDFPIQGAYYKGELKNLYEQELARVINAKYSEKTLSRNFHTFLGEMRFSQYMKRMQI